MAKILIQRWQWGAPLEALEADAAKIRRELAGQLSRLADRHDALERMTIHSNVDTTTHIRATNLTPAHSFAFVLNEEMASYTYEPAKASGAPALATHLRLAADPVLAEVRKSTWFESRVRQSQLYYDLEVQFDVKRTLRPAMSHIIDTFAPPLGRPDKTALQALFPVAAPVVLHKLGIRTTCRAVIANVAFDLSVEIFGYLKNPDRVRASVILLSPDNVPPEEPWFCNALELHTVLWPVIRSFFDKVEDPRGSSEGETKAKKRTNGRKQARVATRRR